MNARRTGSWATALSLLALLAGLSCIGCRSGKSDAGNSYRTVARDPTRDTDRARQLNAKGVELLNKGEWEKAQQQLRAALEADVTFGPAHNNLGKAYFHQGELYLAAWEFQYAAKLMPEQPEPKNNLGLVLERAGKLDEAVQSYDEALALGRDGAQVVANAARCRVRRGDKDQRTLELLQQVLENDPRPSWRRWAGRQLALRGRPVPG
ncbi:tetratricopeptide repeat protein [Fontivita pretiosa]|uniref:tetratricopeptide repeat protein n=1 Tax=Fontivita pretiosa TaxID=2989684 RepID=UPI003D16FB67